LVRATSSFCWKTSSRTNLDLLFPQVKSLKCELFRVSRNANAELDEEEADDPAGLD
jgi:polyphosphate kinase